MKVNTRGSMMLNFWLQMSQDFTLLRELECALCMCVRVFVNLRSWGSKIILKEQNCISLVCSLRIVNSI